ncbi:ERMES complex subunit, partial [Rhizopus stolonifer]
ELNMGTMPPELEILEIGDLGSDKFRGIFKLNYAGDAYIEIQTKVQANPMHNKPTLLPRYSRPGILAADQPLIVPMVLRISQLKLRGIVVLVVSKTKGITLVFKNDPLESVQVSSTFDHITMLRDYLQREIEKQLRNMFQDELPMMVHNLSLRYLQSEPAQVVSSRPMSIYSSNSSLPDLEYPLSPTVSSIDTPLSLDSYDSYWSESVMMKGFHPIYGYSDSQSDILSSTTTLADIYADDADAPWYAKEALIKPVYEEEEQVVFDDLVLRPSENQMVSKLFNLSSVYTLSPLTQVIPHFTSRSLPHMKQHSHVPKTNKIPKRRVTRLNLSIPRL